jgi:hypothetical protein
MFESIDGLPEGSERSTEDADRSNRNPANDPGAGVGLASSSGAATSPSELGLSCSGLTISDGFDNGDKNDD